MRTIINEIIIFLGDNDRDIIIAAVEAIGEIST